MSYDKGVHCVNPKNGNPLRQPNKGSPLRPTYAEVNSTEYPVCHAREFVHHVTIGYRTNDVVWMCKRMHVLYNCAYIKLKDFKGNVEKVFFHTRKIKNDISYYV